NDYEIKGAIHQFATNKQKRDIYRNNPPAVQFLIAVHMPRSIGLVLAIGYFLFSSLTMLYSCTKKQLLQAAHMIIVTNALTQVFLYRIYS
ncbi:hypothetical protein ACJX0J_040856, partial [Zea mays]